MEYCNTSFNQYSLQMTLLSKRYHCLLLRLVYGCPGSISHRDSQSGSNHCHHDLADWPVPPNCYICNPGIYLERFFVVGNTE